MAFTPRPYQVEAIEAAVKYFHDPVKHHAFQILPTGSGKSVVIANIASRLKGKTIVFQPSKEILEQNFRKFISYGFRAGIYSASAGSKFVDTITFATIGSVAKKTSLFKECKNIIIDECDLVNADGGMYSKFINAIPGAKVLGLTATPYRLQSSMEGSLLRFINRSRPRIFSECLYYIQNKVLFDAGHLAKLRYFDETVIDRTRLQAGGSDFSDASVKAYYREIDMANKTADIANRLLAKRKNLLVFCQLIDEAKQVAAKVPGSYVLTGETDMATRTRLLKEFTSGKIKCMINVGVLTVGFDFPELEALLLARSTMSLRLYYQIVGRVMRPHPDKEEAWVVDLGGNYKFFGRVEDLRINVNSKGLYSVWSDRRQLTDIPFTKN
jgi:DNA repair protein RadD